MPAKVAFGFRLVMVSLGISGAVADCLDWLLGSRGHSSTATKFQCWTTCIASPRLPARVTLVGDSELEIRCCWKTCASGAGLCAASAGRSSGHAAWYGTWQRIDSLTLRKGQPGLGWTYGALDPRQPLPHPLVLYWQPGEPRPWLLATNLFDPRARVRLYRRACGLRRCLAI